MKDWKRIPGKQNLYVQSFQLFWSFYIPLSSEKDPVLSNFLQIIVLLKKAIQFFVFKIK